MWTIILIVTVTSVVNAIKVPVENVDRSENDSPQIGQNQGLKEIPIRYEATDSGNSYLLPIMPYKEEEILREPVKTPVTYLLPPAGDSAVDYYKPLEAVKQQDWYPIVPDPVANAPNKQFVLHIPDVDVTSNVRSGKVIQNAANVLPPVPSRVMLPPLENAPNFYLTQDASTEVDSKEQEMQLKYKRPTGLYPKKVVGSFNPIPIPIAQYADNSAEIPKAKPIIPFKPQPIIEGAYLTPLEEKKLYLYMQEEQKRKLRKENEERKKDPVNVSNNEDSNEQNVVKSKPADPETSETINHRPKHDKYPVSANQIGKRPVYVPANKGERTEFRMHGMNGPHSYQFGFDTGKGKNRQFRYEERDNDGHVRGHYGYVDKLGKLRVVNYDADPKLGFRADPPVVHEST